MEPGKKFILSFTLFMLMSVAVYMSGQERIYKTVKVEHREVLVRVVSKGKLVNGLQKGNFRLLINGRERTIQGFAEFKQVIKSSSRDQGSEVQKPDRLFEVIYWIMILF